MAKAKHKTLFKTSWLIIGGIGLVLAFGVSLIALQSKDSSDVRSRASEGSQKCTINPPPVVAASVDGIKFEIVSGRTFTFNDYRKTHKVTKVYIKGVNPKTKRGAPNITARMIWNGDAYKGAVCINQVCQVDVPGPNGFPTRFEAFENEVYTNPGIGIEAGQQLYWDESCRTSGGI